jgi:arylsulfatase A-like enzyme
MTRAPNLIWICADDFAPYVSGAYGNVQAKTPHINNLASEGLLFDRAFCACPLSTPSNQSTWTGRYPRSVGVTLSPTPLPGNEKTLPGLLKAQGYQTAAFGKTHYYAPRRHEFDVYAEREELMSWQRENPKTAIEKDCEVLGPWIPIVHPAFIWLNSRCLPFAAYEKDMASHFYVNSACRFLEQRSRDQPFFLHLGICDTHSPFRFPVEYRGRYKAKDFVAPELVAGDKEEIPVVFRELTDEDKQGIQSAYYTAVEYMDSNVGLLLRAIKDCGYEDNSILIFSSDHGYMLGQHGRFEKHSCYEEAIRVALLMRYPGLIKAGLRSSALISLLDVFPTLLELLNIELSSRVQGQSFAGLLTGRGDLNQHREHIFVEYSDNTEAAVRSDRFKLVYCAGGRERQDGYTLGAPGHHLVKLFDLHKDPAETMNLAGQSAYKDIEEGLLQKLVDHVIQSERYPHEIPEGIDTKKRLELCLKPLEHRL